MAICNNCGKEYLTKECLRCKHGIESKSKRKNINIPMITIAIAVTIIAFIMIRNEYIKHQEEKQIAKLLYGTDDYDEIDKINKKLMKQNEKSMEQLRKLYIPK